MGRTYEALRRAEAKVQKSHLQENQSENNGFCITNQKLETRLNDLGLGNNQILNQNLKEIGQSLKRINACMASPESSLHLQSSDCSSDISADILSTLVERKKCVLDRIDFLVSQKKYHNIKKLLNNIVDEDLKKSLEKNINTLQVKDKILKKEYQQLEQLLLASNSGTSYHPNQIIEEVDQNEKRSQKSARKRISSGLIIVVIVLILLTAFIVLAPLLEIQLLAHPINLALFVLWGTFFGMTVAFLAGFGKKNSLPRKAPPETSPDHRSSPKSTDKFLQLGMIP
jgi:hypothetical protein